jgi:hypothetical protein
VFEVKGQVLGVHGQFSRRYSNPRPEPVCMT